MKARWSREIIEIDPKDSALDKGISFLWRIGNPKETREARGKPPWELRILTKKNITVLIILLIWGTYYFTYQFHSSQEPNFPDGPLFSVEPSLWLQEHRHVVLDYFLSFSWVILFISVGALFFLVAFASEQEFHRYGLVFLATWIIQYLIQLTMNIASPMRDPESDLVFIRYEVFPWSENLIGLKHGAFPSGHIGVTLLVFLIARQRGVKWVERSALVCLVILIWAIMYLGEHYLVDMVASAILYPAIFFVITKWVLPATKSSSS